MAPRALQAADACALSGAVDETFVREVDLINEPERRREITRDRPLHAGLGQGEAEGPLGPRDPWSPKGPKNRKYRKKLVFFDICR